MKRWGEGREFSKMTSRVIITTESPLQEPKLHLILLTLLCPTRLRSPTRLWRKLLRWSNSKLRRMHRLMLLRIQQRMPLILPSNRPTKQRMQLNKSTALPTSPKMLLTQTNQMFPPKPKYRPTSARMSLLITRPQRTSPPTLQSTRPSLQLSLKN